MRATSLRIGMLTGILLVAAGHAGAVADDPEWTDRYVILSGEEQTGYLHVREENGAAQLEYFVDNNGRGPKNSQHIAFDPDGIPVSWAITGESTFGDPVNEFMRWEDGVFEWRSQADSGRIETAMPPLYVANDSSPWSLGIYTRVLMNLPERSLDVMPGGTLSAEPVETITVAGQEMTVWQIGGLDMSPSHIVLDRNGRFIGTAGGGIIHEDFRDAREELSRVGRELSQARLENLHTGLAHTFDGPLRIRNAHIFDPHTVSVTGPHAVTVFDGVITLIEPEAGAPEREGEYVIDAAGGYLVPGLHDMHAHMNAQNGLFYLAAGVTSVRDQGNNPERLHRLMRQIDSGEMPGPRIVPNGMLEGRSPFSVRTGLLAGSLDEALEIVRWYAERGYFQIKIYNSIHPDWVQPIIDESRRLGMGVSGHVPAFVTPDEAIGAGYDDIAHINQLMLGWVLNEGEDTRTPLRLTAMARAADLDLGSDRVQRTVSAMRENGVALDTTAVILELLMLSRAGEYPDNVRGHVEHMPVGYQRRRRGAHVTINTPEDDQRYRAAFQTLLDTLAMLHGEGIQLLPSTDAGTGFPLHRELELYVQAGIPAGETLALATLRAEEFLGRDQYLGSIERGKLADFFLIDEDPTANISAVRQVRFVMRGGAGYMPAEIYTRLGVRPFGAPVEIRTPERPVNRRSDDE
ncbi:MAG: amidohydrolase family protein [Oceanicaulis sp.]|nr:amidohydrolase family protein [Oceanicaulis sp.]